MLAKPYRFHGHNSLKFVYSNGRTVRSRYLNIKYCPNPRRQESRVAVVVAKKVAKRAPTRARIRRRLYEVIRQHWPQLKEGHDLVFTVFDAEVVDMPSAELVRTVTDLLQQAKLYR